MMIIGKVYIKNIPTLQGWLESDLPKQWKKQNWSPDCAKKSHVAWEKTEQINFYDTKIQRRKIYQ